MDAVRQEMRGFDERLVDLERRVTAPIELRALGRVGGVVADPRPSQTRACAIDALGSSPVRFAHVA